MIVFVIITFLNLPHFLFWWFVHLNSTPFEPASKSVVSHCFVPGKNHTYCMLLVVFYSKYAASLVFLHVNFPITQLFPFGCFAQKVSISMVQGCVQQALKGTTYETSLKTGVNRQWVRRFVKRNNMVLKSGRPCEERRAEWGTAKNLLTHYTIVMLKLLAMGAAVANPEYKPDVPYSEPILVTKPHL